METPQNKGYIMMPEWAEHEATWLSWPKNKETFAEMLPQVEKIFLEIVRSLYHNEKVNILIDDKSAEERVRSMIEEAGVNKNVEFHHVKSQDIWIRDYGPLFVKQEEQNMITKWEYNAWGGKYDDLKKDNEIPDYTSANMGKNAFFMTDNSKIVRLF